MCSVTPAQPTPSLESRRGLQDWNSTMTMINCERFIWFYWWCCCHSCNPLGLLAFCSFSLPVTWTQFLGRREFVLKETWCFQLTTGYLNCMYFLVSCRIWFYLFYQHSPRSSRFQPVFPWPQMLKPSHSRVYSFQRKVQSAREKTSGPLLIRPPLTHEAHFGIGLYIYIYILKRVWAHWVRN